MTNIAFYHLERSPLEAALPKLLEKTQEADKRAMVLAETDAQVEALADLLWSYDADAWLPHGSIKDGFADQQPVWLSTADENVNNARFLFLTYGATSLHVGEYDRCFELFDGNDANAVSEARSRWKTYLADGHDLAYWQQTETGGWSKKG